jgi:hypothetical protein
MASAAPPFVNGWRYTREYITCPLQKSRKKYSTSSMNSSKKKLTAEQLESTETLQQKIAALEKQLEWEKLRSEALDTMINIAEKDLDIQIRKKPGAQQLEQ